VDSGVFGVVAGARLEADVQHLHDGGVVDREQLPARAPARGALAGELVAAQQLRAVAVQPVDMRLDDAAAGGVGQLQKPALWHGLATEAN
jgi:hypothetical protein